MQIAVFMRNGRVDRVATTLPADLAMVIEETGEAWSAPLSVESEIVRYCEKARDTTRCVALSGVCEVASGALFEISRRNYDTGRALLSDVRVVLQSFYGGLQTASAL